VSSSEEIEQRLIQVLTDNRQDLAEAWTKAIQEKMSGSWYAQCPPEEIQGNCRVAQDVVCDLLAGVDASHLRWGNAPPETYIETGLPCSEVVEAGILLRDALLTLQASSASPTAETLREGAPLLATVLDRFLVSLVGLYTDAMKRHLDEERRRTALILETTRRVSRTLDLREVLRQSAEGIAAVTGSADWLMYLVDENEGAVVLSAVGGRFLDLPASHRARLLDRSTPLSGHTLLRQIVETKQLATYQGVQALAGRSPEDRWLLDVQTLLGIPCRIKNRVLAVLVVPVLEESAAVAERQVELSLRVADAVAPAIENARLYQKVEQLAIMEERARLAQEIHDELAQLLGAIQIRTSLMRETLAFQEAGRAEAAVTELEGLVSKAYASVREAVFNLRAVVSLESTFASQLKEFLDDYRLHYGMEVLLQVEEGAAAAVSANEGLQAIRIIQEAITNARKHSGAKTALVRVVRDGDDILMSVDDEGMGRDGPFAIAPAPGSFGLRIMKERADKVGGFLTVTSRAGHGTRVALRLPLNGGQQRR
jgi:nitrate/nitrite-specific signal transduction histidine kinase